MTEESEEKCTILIVDDRGGPTLCMDITTVFFR